MTLPRLALSVIGDEIGPSLDEMISFAHEHGLKRLDMRTVGGRNLLGMTKEEIIEISRTLEIAGLTVPTFVSPLFKWPAPGKQAAAGKVDFAFDPKQCPAEDIVEHAIEIAVILGAPHMRIFSYLRHHDFDRKDLTESKYFSELTRLSVHYDISIQLENEPVCNVGNVAELAAFFNPRDESVYYIRPLVDIANAWATGERPSDGDIAWLAPIVTAIHLKDRDLASGRTVPLGDGNVPWPAELERLLGSVQTGEVLASIETHCPQDGRNATARSIAGLRRIAAEIGVEVV